MRQQCANKGKKQPPQGIAAAAEAKTHNALRRMCKGTQNFYFAKSSSSSPRPTPSREADYYVTKNYQEAMIQDTPTPTKGERPSLLAP